MPLAHENVSLAMHSEVVENYHNFMTRIGQVYAPKKIAYTFFLGMLFEIDGSMSAKKPNVFDLNFVLYI
jgi:hypothetical protein